MAIADSRIVRTRGNVLTEHGPKLLPITVVCKQPGPERIINKLVHRADVGFAYSGSTLSALAAHALSSALLSKLVGPPDAPLPGLNEVAFLIAGTAAEYMREVGQLAGQNGLFSSIVFGWCPATMRLRVFELFPEPNAAQLAVTVRERLLQPVRLGGSASESVVVIGSSPGSLIQDINDDLNNAETRGERHPIVAFDAPKRALRKLIAEGGDEMIGGIIQQGQATSAGFEIIGQLERIDPTPPSPRNAGLFILGHDIFNLRQVGNYQVLTEGR